MRSRSIFEHPPWLAYVCRSRNYVGPALACSYRGDHAASLSTDLPTDVLHQRFCPNRYRSVFVPYSSMTSFSITWFSEVTKVPNSISLHSLRWALLCVVRISEMSMAQPELSDKTNTSVPEEDDVVRHRYISSGQLSIVDRCHFCSDNSEVWAPHQR